MDPLLIDISNPRAIREKLPEIQKLYEAKQAELESLRQLIHYVAAISGDANVAAEPVATNRGTRRFGARQNAVEGLRRAGQPMGPAALYRFMSGQPDLDTPPNPNALGASLYAAAKAGEIVRTDEGYAMRPITDYARAGEMGFPVPESANGDHQEFSPTEGASQE